VRGGGTRSFRGDEPGLEDEHARYVAKARGLRRRTRRYSRRAGGVAVGARGTPEIPFTRGCWRTPRRTGTTCSPAGVPGPLVGVARGTTAAGLAAEPGSRKRGRLARVRRRALPSARPSPLALGQLPRRLPVKGHWADRRRGNSSAHRPTANSDGMGAVGIGWGGARDRQAGTTSRRSRFPDGMLSEGGIDADDITSRTLRRMERSSPKRGLRSLAGHGARCIEAFPRRRRSWRGGPSSTTRQAGPDAAAAGPGASGAAGAPRRQRRGPCVQRRA